MTRAAIAASLLIFGFLGAPATALAKKETAIFAGGCFWCVEADFDKVAGVTATESGYTGGKARNPTYDDYAKGGHREAVKITFDPAKVSYEKLLGVFFHSVDPTDAGGQFCDRGKSYSTAVYAASNEQAAAAKNAKREAAGELGRKIVTPIVAATTFWPAEAYHQNYYRSSERILSRFGFVTKARAYKGYRDACGRDARIRQIWGAAAHQGIPGY